MIGLTGWRAARLFAVVGLGFAVASAGCGGSRTHAVQGKVVIEGGEIAQLGESHVEALLDSDPSVRASGQIQPDGSFELTTLQEGKILDGAPQGTYSARLILNDFEYEEPEEEPGNGGAPDYRPRTKNAPKLPVPVKYLSFKNSGWKMAVPADGPVTLTVSNAKKR
jgi:hypothetical protein